MISSINFHRLMGNELAYKILRRLGRGGRERPIQLARRFGVSATAVCNRLTFLKLAGLVECRETGKRRKGRQTYYWLRDRRIARSLETLERQLRRLR